jgi:hypothetical protein
MNPQNEAELARLIDEYAGAYAWVKRESPNASGYAIDRVRAAKAAIIAFVDSVANPAKVA